MIIRVLLLLILLAPMVFADVKSDVDRLFMQASSSSIKYVDQVKPSKDSLIALGDSAAKYLALKLNSTDARERHALVDIFRGIGQAATPYLLEALATDNKDQLRTTARALGEVKDPAGIDGLLRLAVHEDYSIRSQSITSVGKIGGDDALATRVTELLQDSIGIVRKSCVYALGQIGSAQSLPVLADALADDHFAVRLTAYHTLIKFDTLAHAAIAQTIRDTDSDFARALAVRLAGEMKVITALPEVERLLEAEEPLIRGWAVWSWGRLRGRSVTERLRSCAVVEDDLFVRSQLAETIAYLQNSSTDE